LSTPPAMSLELFFYSDPQSAGLTPCQRWGYKLLLIVQAPRSLKFSAGPGQTFPLSTTPFVAIFLADIVTGCPQGPWALIAPCFQVLPVAQTSSLSHLSGWCWAMALWDMGSNKVLSSSLLACYTGVVTVTSNSHTGLKTCGKSGFLLRLSLPVCQLGLMAYLWL
jgi:hypothetical protein